MRAQKLCSNAEHDGDEDTAEEKVAEKEIDKEAAEEIPLGRSNTGCSLASDLVTQRNAQKEGQKEKGYSMPYAAKTSTGWWTRYFYCPTPVVPHPRSSPSWGPCLRLTSKLPG